MSDLMKVGPDWGGTGTFKPFTSSISGAQRSANSHGLYMDANLRGAVFSGGIPTLLTISNVSFAIATLGATATPLVGVWNPATSLVNLVIIQASLSVVTTAATATGAGPYYWCASSFNTVVTGGTTPLNRRTLALTGSNAKVFPGTALTGLTTNLVVAGASSLGGGQMQGFSFVATAAGSPALHMGSTEFVDGLFIVPPGGVLALLCANTPVAHSATSMLVWEEVPILP